MDIIWDVPASAAARAIADASGECTSTGNAFGCAKAQAQAAAWASATAEAHAHAYAEAFNGCGLCDTAGTQVEASSEVIASTFVELMADVYAQAEIQVCVAGDQTSSASAWSNCFATAYARIVRFHPRCMLCHSNKCVIVTVVPSGVGDLATWSLRHLAAGVYI